MESVQTTATCQVCGDSASIVNYGVLSCLPCRTFFRRNAFYSQELRPCRYGYSCEMNLLTRKMCSSCRLARCFSVGMTLDLIRKKPSTTKRRRFNTVQDVECISMRIPQESPLDQLVGENDLCLNQQERVLISNVVHAFDAFNPKSQIENIIKLTNKSPSNIPYNVWYLMQVVFSTFNCVLSFITSTPDFKILTLSEQASLFRRNFLGVMIGSVLPISQESRLFEKPENELVFSLIYGSKITQQVRFILRQIDFDPIIFKLVLMPLAFSSNCYMIDCQESITEDSLLLGTFRLFGSQNAYVELLWKFLLVKYGFDGSVRIFSTMTKQLLHAFSISMDAYNDNKVHEIILDGIIRQTRTSSIVNGRNSIPLWGRQ